MPTERPIIGFLTDFGLDGAAATCRGVMLSICRDAQIVDISHTVRKYAIRDGAFLLGSALPYLPVGVHVGVIDPGVGTERRAIAIRTGRGDVLIGPDNGLLVQPAEALGGAVGARELANRDLWLPVTTSTFHGRDIFAPVAAHLAAGSVTFEAVGPTIPTEDLVRLPAVSASIDDETLRTEVIYIDSFGNLRLAGGGPELEALGWPAGQRVGAVIGSASDPIEATLVETFGGVGGIGVGLLYVDSSGNLALALNQANLAELAGAVPGDSVVVSPSDGAP
jgi:S-adenosyl-L-methionine hydrolase (adenosine-forming)